MVTTNTSYRLISENLSRSLNSTAEKPEVAREVENYLENIGDVKSVDDFINNDRIYRFALTAFGLQDQIFAKAFIRKVLTEGVTDPNSFANRLADGRFRELARTFNFAGLGETTTLLDRTRQGTVDRYIRQTLEQDAGEQNEGVRLALYFERNASSITSGFSVLADAALLKVVRTTLGLPESLSSLDIDRQAEIIESRLDVTDLQDPEKLSQFITRFTILYETENPSTVATSPALLLSQPVEAGISVDLLASIQNLKRGGF